MYDSVSTVNGWRLSIFGLFYLQTKITYKKNNAGLRVEESHGPGLVDIVVQA